MYIIVPHNFGAKIRMAHIWVLSSQTEANRNRLQHLYNNPARCRMNQQFLVPKLEKGSDASTHDIVVLALRTIIVYPLAKNSSIKRESFCEERKQSSTTKSTSIKGIGNLLSIQLF